MYETLLNELLIVSDFESIYLAKTLPELQDSPLSSSLTVIPKNNLPEIRHQLDQGALGFVSRRILHINLSAREE